MNEQLDVLLALAGQNVSIIGGLSLDGLIQSMSINGSVNTEVFLTYVTQVLVPQLWQGAIVVMDNLKVPDCDFNTCCN